MSMKMNTNQGGERKQGFREALKLLHAQCVEVDRLTAACAEKDRRIAELEKQLFIALRPPSESLGR